MKSPKLLTLAATAALITSASATVTIDWVTVGNAGNAADTTSYGAVSYAYQIGKYEVTNTQYGAFLNAAAKTDSHGLYDFRMDDAGIGRNGTPGSYTYSVYSGEANHPVRFISWYDAARFSNWMHNGQGNGSTENGAYTLNGNTGIVTKNVGATIYIPTEDEWYKAAYYNGSTSTYSLYPNGQNSITTAAANYGMSIRGLTNVGTYPNASFYGTLDQGGNVWEWNDAVISNDPETPAEERGIRGGSWGATVDYLASTYREPTVPANGTAGIGFRLASVNAIPEPSSMLLTMVAGGMMLIRRKR
jgi:formylglycine-generating enzyme required for sulfatase activity